MKLNELYNLPLKEALEKMREPKTGAGTEAEKSFISLFLTECRMA